MNLIRCRHCGENADTEFVTDCPGCGQPLLTDGAPLPPRRTSPLQQEAKSDIDRSSAILFAIAAVGLIGVMLIVFKEKGFMAAVIPIGIGLAALYGIFAPRMKRVKATASPRPAPNVPARLNRPRPRYVPASVPQENGVPSCLQVIGWLLLIVVAIILGGIVILFITCAF